MYSKYSNYIKEIFFEAPKTVKENGTANYVFEIVSADNASFKAVARSITDFDNDGVFNVWEITETGVLKETTKD